MQVVVACVGGDEFAPRSIEVHGESFRTSLGVQISGFYFDPFHQPERLFEIHNSIGSMVFIDLERRAVISVPYSYHVMGVVDDHALLYSIPTGQLWFLDAATGKLTQFRPRGLGHFEHWDELGRFVVFHTGPDTIVDIAERRVVGRVNGRTLAISREGRHALVAPGPHQGTFPHGPLRWVIPGPP
jgi:hypothetical protein